MLRSFLQAPSVHFLTFLLTIFVTFFASGRGYCAGNEAQIAALKEQVNSLLQEPMGDLSWDVIAQRKARFEELLKELKQLEEQQAVMVAEVPQPIEPPFQLAPLPSISPKSEQVNLPSLGFVDSPRSREEALWFFARTPDYAWAAMKSYFGLPGGSGQSIIPRVDETEAMNLLEALESGVKKGNFATMTAVMELIDFSGTAIERIDGMGEPRYTKLGVPFFIAFTRIEEKAIVSWLRLKPDAGDVRQFFSAQKLKWPLLSSWFTYPGPQAYFDSGELLNVLIANHYVPDLATLFDFAGWIGAGGNLTPPVALKYATEVKTEQDLNRLFSTSHFAARILLFAQGFDKSLFHNAIEANILTRVLFEQVESAKEDEQNAAREFKRGDIKEASYVKTRAKSQQMTEAFNWLGYKYADKMVALGAKADDLAFFKNEKVLRRGAFQSRYYVRSSFSRRAMWKLKGEPVPELLQKEGYGADTGGSFFWNCIRVLTGQVFFGSTKSTST